MGDRSVRSAIWSMTSDASSMGRISLELSSTDLEDSGDSMLFDCPDDDEPDSVPSRLSHRLRPTGPTISPSKSCGRLLIQSGVFCSCAVVATQTMVESRLRLFLYRLRMSVYAVSVDSSTRTYTWEQYRSAAHAKICSWRATDAVVASSDAGGGGGSSRFFFFWNKAVANPNGDDDFLSSLVLEVVPSRNKRSFSIFAIGIQLDNGRNRSFSSKKPSGP